MYQRDVEWYKLIDVARVALCNTYRTDVRLKLSLFLSPPHSPWSHQQRKATVGRWIQSVMRCKYAHPGISMMYRFSISTLFRNTPTLYTMRHALTLAYGLNQSQHHILCRTRAWIPQSHKNMVGVLAATLGHQSSVVSASETDWDGKMSQGHQVHQGHQPHQIQQEGKKYHNVERLDRMQAWAKLVSVYSQYSLCVVSVYSPYSIRVVSVYSWINLILVLPQKTSSWAIKFAIVSLLPAAAADIDITNFFGGSSKVYNCTCAEFTKINMLSYVFTHLCSILFSVSHWNLPSKKPHD